MRWSVINAVFNIGPTLKVYTELINCEVLMSLYV